MADISDMLCDWVHDSDPHGIIPTGWVLPGQYEVVCFPAPTGTDVLDLTVGLKYPNCTGRYSTTRAYIYVLRDYLDQVGLTVLGEAVDRWRAKKIKEFEKEQAENAT